MTTEEKIAVMQAYLDGKVIEISPRNQNDWGICKCPLWDWRLCDYRVWQLPEYKLDRGKYNKISELLKEKYVLDELEVQQLIMEVGEIFGVTIKTE